MLEELCEQYGAWWGRYQEGWKRCNWLIMQASHRKMEELRKAIDRELNYDAKEVRADA